MSEKLRTLAEAEAKNEFHPDRQPFNLYDARRLGYVRGFIAGRTSVTSDDLFEVILDAMPNMGVPLANLDGVYNEAAALVRDAVLALLRGETSE